MKLIKAIIPVLFAALATGFTACSDDDDYVVGQNSPGAYFEASLPGETLIPMEGPSFEIQVNRTSADAPATYAVTSDAPSCFNVPATVTFDGDALTTNLVVSYDPANVEQDKPYNVTFALDPASNYGNSTYTVTLLRSVPRETIVWSGHTTGVYTYTQLLTGYGEYDVTWTYNPNTPTKDIVVNVGIDDPSDPDLLWMNAGSAEFGGLVLHISMPDTEVRLSNGCIPVFVDVQQVTTNPLNGNDVAVADVATFWRDDMGRPDGYEAYKNTSYYDPKTGVFSLNLIYFIPASGGRYYGEGYEYLNLAGFPDYEVDAMYAGLFRDADNEYSVYADIVMGNDVAKAKTALVDAANDAEAIKAVAEGLVETQTVENGGEDSYRVIYPVSKAGQYYMTVVGYSADGKQQQSVAVPVQIVLGGSAVRPNGNGYMIDGWIAPAFEVTYQDGSVATPEELEFVVNFGIDSQDPTLNYLINPYNTDLFPITRLGGNAYGKDRNIAFTMDGDYISFEPQLSGFGGKNWGGELTLSNFEGYIASELGYNKDQVISYMAQKGIERTTLEDYLITVPACLWGYPANQGGDFGYTWKKWKISYIQLPGADAAKVARMKAESVAQPKFASIANRAAMRSAINEMKTTKRFNRAITVKSIR